MVGMNKSKTSDAGATGDRTSAAEPLSLINRLFNHRGLRRFFVKLRTPLVLAAVTGALLLVRPSPWFWGGLVVSLCGATAQWWCFACIMTSKELACNGPYRFVRNPMYLARFVMVLGLLLMVDPTQQLRWLAPAVFVVFYGFFMHNRVRREEHKLRAIFGKPYEEYLRKVPRFLPALQPRFVGKTFYWNKTAFRRNNGARNMALVLAGYAIACALTYGVRANESDSATAIATHVDTSPMDASQHRN